jgi:hypothetical protein
VGGCISKYALYTTRLGYGLLLPCYMRQYWLCQLSERNGCSREDTLIWEINMITQRGPRVPTCVDAASADAHPGEDWLGGWLYSLHSTLSSSASHDQ